MPAVQKAPPHLCHWDLKRRPRVFFHMGFPSRRDCTGTTKDLGFVLWVQFLMMMIRNLSVFLAQELKSFLMNLGPSGEAPHTAAGAL